MGPASFYSLIYIDGPPDLQHHFIIKLGTIQVHHGCLSLSSHAPLSSSALMGFAFRLKADMSLGWPQSHTRPKWHHFQCLSTSACLNFHTINTLLTAQIIIQFTKHQCTYSTCRKKVKKIT